MANKKILTLAIIFVASIILIGIGATYAYYTAVVSGNESSTTMTVTSGEIKVAYSNGTSISASNIVPGWSDTKYFTVTATNTTGKAISYTVDINVTTNTFNTTTAYLNYQLFSCTSSKTSCTTSLAGGLSGATSPTKVPTSTSTIYTSSDITSTTTTYYALTIEFPNLTSAQDQGKSFSGYVNISSSSQVSNS